MRPHAPPPSRVSAARRPLLAAAGATATLGLLLGLTESVRQGDPVVRLDARVLDVVVAHRVGWLSTLARTITALGSLAVVTAVVAVAAVLLLARRHARHAVLLVASSAGTAALVELVKHVVGRARPPLADRLVAAGGPAFPSGHTAQGVACYLALAFVTATLVTGRRARLGLWVSALVLAVAIGGSRVYLGVHWLSDVVGGWLLAGCWLCVLVGTWYARPGPGPDQPAATSVVP